MSKPIRITEKEIESVKDAFFKALEKVKVSDGKFSFSKTLDDVNRKATLLFTEKAWIKQSALISNFSDEVAWHGVARRGEDESIDEYIIDDILVYPQEVTGATVTTDQEKYQNWLYSQEDEVFNNIRMQGHSHVNMGVTPSSVDTTLYENILEQLENDMFYIFLIWNKKGDKTVKIYDLEKNVLFETKDVEIGIIDEVIGLDDFIDDAKSQVTRRVVNTTSYNGYTPKTTSSKQQEKDTSVTKKQFASAKKKAKKYGSQYRSQYGYYYDGWY